MSDATRPPRRTLIAATMALATPVLRAAAEGDPRRIDFEGMRAGAPPTGFTFALTGGGPAPHWVVVEDASSAAGPKVLAENSGDRTDYRFPLAILDGFSARDVALSVRFRAVEGRVDRAAGLVVRYRDAGNYYVARANALEDNVRLYRVVDGRRTQFAGVSASVPRDRWQTLGLRIQGDRIEVALDGRRLFGATDRSFTEAGGIGLWTKADSVTLFDALEVQPLG